MSRQWLQQIAGWVAGTAALAVAASVAQAQVGVNLSGDGAQISITGADGITRSFDTRGSGSFAASIDANGRTMIAGNPSARAFSVNPFGAPLPMAVPQPNSQTRSIQIGGLRDPFGAGAAIAVADGPGQVAVSGASAPQLLMAVKLAAKRNDYAAATRHAETALAAAPGDAEVLQHLAMLQMAQRDYRKAASAQYEAVMHGARWSWPRYRDLFATPDDFVKVYRDLQTEMKRPQPAPEAPFLLMHMELALSHPEAAAKLMETLSTPPATDPVMRELHQHLLDLQRAVDQPPPAQE